MDQEARVPPAAGPTPGEYAKLNAEKKARHARSRHKKVSVEDAPPPSSAIAPFHATPIVDDLVEKYILQLGKDTPLPIVRKRCHSAVWHSERKRLKRDAISDEIAKHRASEKACKELERFDARVAANL